MTSTGLKGFEELEYVDIRQFRNFAQGSKCPRAERRRNSQVGEVSFNIGHHSGYNLTCYALTLFAPSLNIPSLKFRITACNETREQTFIFSRFRALQEREVSQKISQRYVHKKLCKFKHLSRKLCLGGLVQISI